MRSRNPIAFRGRFGSSASAIDTPLPRKAKFSGEDAGVVGLSKWFGISVTSWAQARTDTTSRNSKQAQRLRGRSSLGSVPRSPYMIRCIDTFDGGPQAKAADVESLKGVGHCAVHTPGSPRCHPVSPN